MAEVTRVNGIGHALGTLYSTMQLKAFKVTPSATAFVAGIGNSAEAMAQEFGTTGAMVEFAADGSYVVIIGDGHALDAATVDARAEAVHGEAVTTAELTSILGA